MARMERIGKMSDKHVDELMKEFQPSEAVMCCSMTLVRLWRASGGKKESVETSIEVLRCLFAEIEGT
jgi:hypothetical protein